MRRQDGVGEREDVEFISPHKCIKSTSKNGTILTEHQLNTSSRPQTPKVPERSPRNQVGWKKEEGKRKRKGSRMRPVPLVREMKERRGSCIRGTTLTGRKFSWNRRGTLGAIGGECSNWSVAGRAEWDIYWWSMPQPCMPQPEMCVCQWGWGLSAGTGVWRANLVRGLLLAVRRQTEGMGVRKSATGNACGGNPDCHRSEAPLLSDMQGTGPHCSLSLHSLATASLDTRTGSRLGRLSCTCGCWLHHATHPHKGSHDPRGCWLLLCTTSLSWRALSWPQPPLPPGPLLTRVDSCAPGQPWEQLPVGGPQAEVRLKPQLSPKGHANNEENLKPLLAAVQIANWHPTDQLCKLSAYRISEQTTSAPEGKTGLALVTVDFVGTFMWELGQARVWAAPIAPTACPDLWLLQS